MRPTTVGCPQTEADGGVEASRKLRMEEQLIEAGRFQVSEAVVSAELGGEGVLLDIATGLYYGLDETGSQIWRLVREGLGASDICDRLLSEYDVDPERLRTDITGFLDQLEQNGLIRTRPGK